MNLLFIDKPTPYDGSQLRSHWIFDQAGLKGDAIVAFAGPCKVDLGQMVDLEDVVQKKPIYSENMLHWIVEHFDNDLEKMVMRQRLLMVCIQEEIISSVEDVKVLRRGDDLFFDDRKLSVSIATTSPVSCLIHAAVNISTNNTPLPTAGLEELGLNPQALGFGAMNRYAEEMQSIHWARCKVRGVL